MIALTDAPDVHRVVAVDRCSDARGHRDIQWAMGCATRNVCMQCQGEFRDDMGDFWMEWLCPRDGTAACPNSLRVVHGNGHRRCARYGGAQEDALYDMGFWVVYHNYNTVGMISGGERNFFAYMDYNKYTAMIPVLQEYFSHIKSKRRRR